MKLSKLAIALIFVFVIFRIISHKYWQDPGRVIVSDVNSYYGYLPATIIHGDPELTFLDSTGADLRYKEMYTHSTLPNGGRVFRMTMGLSFLYSPFFLLSHGYAKITGSEALGFSTPYRVGLMVSCLFYLFLGYFFLMKTLRLYFSDWIVALTLLCLGIGTNLFYYTTAETTMSHAYSFSLLALFIFLVHKWEDVKTVSLAISIGLVFGLIVLVRPIDIVFGSFFLFFGVSDISSLKVRGKVFFDYWLLLLIAALSALLVWIPQLVYWKMITGQFLFNSYLHYNKFYFTDPEIINVLFSYRKGLFLYTPMMVLSLVGFVWMLKKNKKLFFPLFFTLTVNLYLIASWWCWWYGGGFGHRAFIDSYPFMAFGLSYFFLLVYNKKRKWVLIPVLAVLFLLIRLNIFQSWQYHYTLIHWDSMTKEAYWEVFGKNHWPNANYENLFKSPDYDAALRGEDEY